MSMTNEHNLRLGFFRERTFDLDNVFYQSGLYSFSHGTLKFTEHFNGKIVFII